MLNAGRRAFILGRSFHSRSPSPPPAPPSSFIQSALQSTLQSRTMMSSQAAAGQVRLKCLPRLLRENTIRACTNYLRLIRTRRSASIARAWPHESIIASTAAKVFRALRSAATPPPPRARATTPCGHTNRITCRESAGELRKVALPPSSAFPKHPLTFLHSSTFPHLRCEYDQTCLFRFPPLNLSATIPHTHMHTYAHLPSSQCRTVGSRRNRGWQRTGRTTWPQV